MPWAALVAPGPRVTKQTPGRPVTLPMASAIIAGAGLLPAHRDGNIAVMERIQHREIALAGHAENMLHAVDAQLVDQNFGGTAQIVLGAHFTLLGRPIRGRKLRSPCPIRPGIGMGRA